MSLMNEGKTRPHQNGSQAISNSFQASKSFKVRKMGVADSDEDTTSDPGDVYDPRETVSVRQHREVHSRFDEPLSENLCGRVDSANEEAEDVINPEVARDISDPVRSLNLRQPAFHPPLPSPRVSLPPGSPVFSRRKTSKGGHLDAASLSQVVLPPTPAPGTFRTGYSAAPPAVPPRVPARGSVRSASQSTPSPAILSKRFNSMQALGHSRTRRAPLPPPPTIAEVASVVHDDYCGDLDASVPSVPQRSIGRHTSNAADRIQSKMAHSRRQAATVLKGHEAQRVTVDSGNPTRSKLSSTSRYATCKDFRHLV